jgi:hypothetical protein
MIKAKHRVAIYLRVSTLDQTTANHHGEDGPTRTLGYPSEPELFRDSPIDRQLKFRWSTTGKSAGFSALRMRPV